MTVSVNDVVRFTVKGRLVALVETRSMFTYKAYAGTPKSDTVVYDALRSATEHMFSHMLPAMTNLWVGYGGSLHKLVGTEWIPLLDGSWTGTGTAAGEMSAYQLAYYVRAFTGEFKTWGRKFLPGVAELLVSNGILLASVMTALAAFIVDYLGIVNCPGDLGLLPGVVRKDFTFSQFTGASASNLVSTMRRRKPGYGI